MSDFAKDSGHWYTEDGEPAYEVPNASKGGMRPTKITDARKHGYLPSVTSIMGIVAKPALTQWMVNQGIESALTSPHLARYEAGELTDKAFMELLNTEAREQAKNAAEEGSRIHGIVERYFQGDIFNGTDETVKYVNSVISCLCELGIEHDWRCWASEKSFAANGYGGKVDLHNENAVIDFKTVDKDLDLVNGYDEQVAQLAAYRYGLGLPEYARLINIYIHRKTAECKAIEWAPEQARFGLDYFMASFNLWKVVKRWNQ